MGDQQPAKTQSPNRELAPKAKVSEYEQDILFWKGCAEITMRSGLVIKVVKVVSVKRYVILVAVEGYDHLLLINKHAVDMAVLKSQVALRPPA